MFLFLIVFLTSALLTHICLKILRPFEKTRMRLEHDYCPRIYNGWRHDRHGCDHSERQWALQGFYKEYLTSQPLPGDKERIPEYAD